MGTAEGIKEVPTPVNPGTDGNHHASLYRLASEAPFFVIFHYAYKRIWSGNLLWKIETFGLCAVISFLCFYGYHLTPIWLDQNMYFACGIMTLILTPMVIGMAIYKSHVTVGMADSFLRTVPLTPLQILLPRILAVISVLFLVVIPWTATMLILERNLIAQEIWPENDSLIWFSLKNLLLNFSDITKWSGYPLTLSPGIYQWWRAIYMLALCQIVGFFAFPVFWGFYWAEKFQRKGGLFILAYFSWILFPVAYITLIKWGLFDQIDNIRTELNSMLIISGLAELILGIIFLVMTIRLWKGRIS